MIPTYKTYIFILLILSGAIISSCKKRGCTDINAINFDEQAGKDDGSCKYKAGGSIYLILTHHVDGEVLIFDSIQYINNSENNYSITALKYFISNVVLHKEDNSTYKLDNINYIDVKNQYGTSIFLTDIPNGYYTGVSFLFGIDSIKNVSGYFTNTPESNMEWPDILGGGYHYMKLEGKYDSVSKIKSYNIHTGISRKITGSDTTFYHNYIPIEFNNNTFEINNNEWDIQLKMNINKWFTEPNDYNFDTWGSAIMGNHEAQQAIKENGYNIFEITSIHAH